MSSHHSIKFFITHYGQEQRAEERRRLKEERRKIERQERALYWAEQRQQRAILKARAQWLYIEAELYFWAFVTVAAGVIYIMRNV